MTGQLLTVDATADLIESGAHLVIAGDSRLVGKLPRGSWIAGSTPYFMTADGGTVTKDMLFVGELPDRVVGATVRSYGPDELPGIASDGYEHGYTLVIVPAFTTSHERYAHDAIEWDGLFDRPVVGWVAGVHLDDLGADVPAVFAGDGNPVGDAVVAMHVQLPDGVLASADIVNLFTQGDGPALTFEQTGFAQQTVLVDGVARDFAEFLRETGHDTKLPLVADYFGAMINVSIQSVPDDGTAVTLYAPVFDGVEYRLAGPVGDYSSEFAAHLPPGSVDPTFACNCILNFVYSELEGRRTGDVTGPVTFGEIAYQLLNQTMVYLTVHEESDAV